MGTELAVKQQTLAKQLNESVFAVIGNEGMQGFERAYQIANAIQDLKGMLTPEYMKPIMAMQGNRLGFKTDKDKSGGYPEETVKNCLIEAVLIGVQPYGNQFNIIAGSCYITKEGFGFLLAKFKGLKNSITLSLPRVNNDKTGAAVTATIEWELNGESNKKEVDIPIKMDAYTTVDAIIGKATRKSRAWLFNSICDIEVADGDVQDISHEVVGSTKPNLAQSQQITQTARIKESINKIDKSFSPVELEAIEQACGGDEELLNMFNEKRKSAGL